MEPIRTALILAAGFGTRMQSLNQNLPKPLLVASGKTLLQWQIENLMNLGISEIGINIHYHGELMKSAILSIQRTFSKIKLFQTYEFPEILGQGGGIRTLLEMTDSNQFLVCNSDAFINLKRFAPKISFDPEKIHLASVPYDQKFFLSRLQFTPSFKIVPAEFAEGNQETFYYPGYMIASRRHFEHLTPNQNYDLKSNVWDKWADAICPWRIEDWLDLGEATRFRESEGRLKTFLA